MNLTHVLHGALGPRLGSGHFVFCLFLRWAGVEGRAVISSWPHIAVADSMASTTNLATLVAAFLAVSTPSAECISTTRSTLGHFGQQGVRMALGSAATASSSHGRHMLPLFLSCPLTWNFPCRVLGMGLLQKTQISLSSSDPAATSLTSFLTALFRVPAVLAHRRARLVMANHVEPF